jgi:addiction module HigA family antidote
MATAERYAFNPDYAIPPGATLKEVLDSKGISQAELAIRMGMADKTISQIINGIAPISFDTAYKLELVLGIAASFWNRLELAYRERLTLADETQKLNAHVAWLKELPVKELVQRHLVEPTNDKAVMVRRLLEFFGVSSVEAWRGVLAGAAIQFRGGKSHSKYPGYVAAWRRIGVLQAQEIQTEAFDAQDFGKALDSVRAVTMRPATKWFTELTSICAKAGVCVVLTKEIPRASVSGSARWLTKDKALIQLSLKYKSDDQIWFSFFHEAGHILNHGKKDLFVDYGYSEDDALEREANDFARNKLIPPEFEKYLPHLTNSARIRKFASDIGVSPGIVVGRLHHDQLAPRHKFQDLIARVDWE